MVGWKTELPEKISLQNVQSWSNGIWFQYRMNHRGIGKIKTVMRGEEFRIIVLWMHAQDLQSISIQIYRAEMIKESDKMLITWIDGYAFGHQVDDEDDIINDRGELNESLMIATIDESLENMEFGLVNRRELNVHWQAYRNGTDIDLPVEPYFEGR